MGPMSGPHRIAVVMGGPSGEHEISLKSGHGIVNALAQRRWSVTPIVIPHALGVAEAAVCASRALLETAPDVVFIALHGAFGEDGTIQRVCEELHLAYTGSDVAASRLGMDKVASRKRFEDAGLRVPAWHTVDLTHGTRCGLAEIHARLRSGRAALPLVIKPTSQGSSLGVSIARREEERGPALEDAGRYGPSVLVEAFIQGRELTVGILHEAPLPVIEIRPHAKFFDFTAKYTAGSTDYVAPAALEPAIAEAAQAAGLTAHRAIGCRHFSRADLILSREHVPVVLEINTIPGFTPTSLLPKAARCVGLSYEALCEQLVIMAWEGTRPERPSTRMRSLGAAPSGVKARSRGMPHLVR